MSKEIGKNRKTLIIYSPRFIPKDDKGVLEEIREFWEKTSGKKVEVNLGEMGEATISFEDKEIRMLRQSKTPRKILREKIAV